MKIIEETKYAIVLSCKNIDETEDRIVITYGKFDRIVFSLVGLFYIAFGLLVGRELLSNAPDSIGELISSTFLVVIPILIGTYLSVNLLFLHKTITVNKTLERVIIKVDSIIKPLKSLKEIPFLDINEFQIENPLKEDGPWRINLITNDNKSELIFEEISELYTREIANKINNLTGKNITNKGC